MSSLANWIQTCLYYKVNRKQLYFLKSILVKVCSSLTQKWTITIRLSLLNSTFWVLVDKSLVWNKEWLIVVKYL